MQVFFVKYAAHVEVLEDFAKKTCMGVNPGNIFASETAPNHTGFVKVQNRGKGHKKSREKNFSGGQYVGMSAA